VTGITGILHEELPAFMGTEGPP